MPLIILLYFL